MPKKDGLVRLPDHVTATLLRALMSIRPRPESRLMLQRIDYGRPPGWDAKTDFNVHFRGREIGRIWRHEYKDHGDYSRHPWHWYFRGVPGRPDTTGHAPTLEAAMADFRKAWDAASESGVA
jgi:hypothetical protein